MGEGGIGRDAHQKGKVDLLLNLFLSWLLETWSRRERLEVGGRRPTSSLGPHCGSDVRDDAASWLTDLNKSAYFAPHFSGQRIYSEFSKLLSAHPNRGAHKRGHNKAINRGGGGGGGQARHAGVICFSGPKATHFTSIPLSFWWAVGRAAVGREGRREIGREGRRRSEDRDREWKRRVGHLWWTLPEETSQWIHTHTDARKLMRRNPNRIPGPDQTLSVRVIRI